MKSKPIYAERFVAMLLASLTLFFQAAQATELYEMNPSVRALGMGNAYLGVASDSDALFYNPAGLARVTGYNWLIMDPRAGIDGTQAMTFIKDFMSSSDLMTTVQNHFGDSLWAGAGAKTAFTMPYLGVALYDSLDASLMVNNPVYPTVESSVINDFGYIMGAGIPLLPGLHFGVATKYIRRSGNRFGLSAGAIGNQSSDLTTALNTKGHGYGLDLGVNVMFPVPISPVISFSWQNVGRTTYKTDVVTLAAPPSDESNMSVGMAFELNFPLVSVAPAIDFKYLDRADVQLGKKIHLGVEIGVPLLDIRAGFSEGYYTLGLGLDLGIIRVDAASYGVELGEYPGQLEDRRYVVQATIELGFDPASGSLGGGSRRGGSSAAASGGKGGKGGSGGGSSGGGGFSRRLKARR